MTILNPYTNRFPTRPATDKPVDPSVFEPTTDRATRRPNGSERRQRRMVVCEETGEVMSQERAAAKVGFATDSIRSACTPSMRKRTGGICGGFTWRYATAEEIQANGLGVPLPPTEAAR